MECQEHLQGRLTENLARELGKYKLDLVGVQEIIWEKGSSERAEDYVFLWKRE
jgi:hypothetical protein